MENEFVSHEGECATQHKCPMKEEVFDGLTAENS
jgi:hypothetical protein